MSKPPLSTGMLTDCCTVAFFFCICFFKFFNVAVFATNNFKIDTVAYL